MPRKKIFLLSFVGLIICILLFGIYSQLKKKNNSLLALKKNIDYTDFILLSKQKKVIQNAGTIVNYFSPDCEFCSYFFEDLNKNLTTLGKVNVILISQMDSSSTCRFIQKNGLDTMSFIRVYSDPSRVMPLKYAISTTPTFLIFDENHNFLSIIKGETKIQNLINELKK